MSHYPGPVLVPDDVLRSRKERLRQLVRSCTWGIAIRFSIIVAEFAGFIIFESSALLMDALASFIDVFATVLLVGSIKFAARPPDKNHPFGHGRFEPLIGLQMGIFMALVGAGMLVQQVFHLSTVAEHGISGYAWIIPLCAVILLEISYQVVMSAARRQDSPALLAEAAHYRIDGLTSMCAMIALIAAAFFPSISGLFDHIGAILIAILMIGFGVYALKQNLNQLIDRVPEQDYFKRVRIAALRVDGVRETEKIRIQQTGPDAHVDIDIEVDPFLTVEVAHFISQKVRVEIQKEWPLVQDVTVHIEPYYPGDH
jgi:cation diffusion facilitator family transporter